MNRAENLFAGLQTAQAVINLIGEAEDAHFDCKEWPARDDDAQKASTMRKEHGFVKQITYRWKSLLKEWRLKLFLSNSLKQFT